MIRTGASLTILRILGGGLALSLMIGEAIRTWGTGRPWPFWFDDYWTGGLLLAGAVLMARPTPLRSHVFVAGWAACLGMLFGSFFGKVYDPASSTPGNFDLGFLTVLIGMAFVTAAIGLVWSLKETMQTEPSNVSKSKDWGQWGSQMISPKQHYARINAALTEMVERVPEFTIEIPVPETQAKWNDLANEWYVERHPDRWQLIFFDGNGSRWKIIRRENYDTDEDLLFALVSMRLGFYRGDAFRLEVMTKISPEFGEREALLQTKHPNREK